MQTNIAGWERHINTDFMEKLVPVNSLSQPFRVQLFKKARFDKLTPGTNLLPDQERNWLLYVIRGTFMHASQPNNKNSIDPLKPLFNQEQGKAIQAKTECLIVRFDRKLFDILLQEDQFNGYHVDEIMPSEIENNIFAQFMQDYNSDKIELPGIPELSIKIRNAVNAEDSSIPKIARVIETDPALCAKLLRQANCASFSDMPHISTINQAVQRLGISTVKTITDTHAITELFKSGNSQSRKRMQFLYKESMYLAKTSYLLSKNMRNFSPEKALLCGLLCNIGTIPVIMHFEKLSNSTTDSSILDNVIINFQKIFGGMLLRKWDFDEYMVSVAENSDDWSWTSKSADYIDLIIAARWLNLGTFSPNALRPPINQVIAFRTLGIEYTRIDELREYIFSTDKNTKEADALLGI